MGYYTHFEIEAIGEYSQAAVDAVKERSQYSWSDDDLYEAKWYDWKKDVMYVSAKFPNATIVITGHGEERGDEWKAWFRDCAFHISKAKFVFEQPEWLSK